MAGAGSAAPRAPAKALPPRLRGAVDDAPNDTQEFHGAAAFAPHLDSQPQQSRGALVVIDQNESHFLRQQAARIRTLAQSCTRSVSEELLAMARELEQRARDLESKAG